MRRLRPVLIVLGLLLAVAAAAALLIGQLGLRATIESEASRTLGRQVSIGSLQIGWGFPLSVRLTELKVANAPWGSRPDMVRIGSLSAEIDPWPLLRGVLELRKLEIGGLSLLLERDADRRGNWHFGGGSPPRLGPFALIPKDRTQLPMLLDARLSDGEIVLRNRRGGELTIGLQTVDIHSPNADAPMQVTGAGSYNGHPLQLTASTDSSTVLHDPHRPFGASASLAAAGAHVAFDGTIMDPVNFDGVEGVTELTVDHLSTLLAFIDVQLVAPEPLQLAGTVSRHGDHWQLSGSKGRLADIDMSGSLALQEGAIGAPDRVEADLDLGEIDLARLLAEQRKAGATLPSAIGLPMHPDPQIAGRIRAKAIRQGTLSLADLRAEGSLDDRGLSLEQLHFGLAGGSVKAVATARPGAAGTALALSASLAAADLGRLAALIGAGPGLITGRLDADLTIKATGKTVQEALAASRGQAVLRATHGRIARDLIKKASIDLPALFSKPEGMTPVSCLISIAELRGGVLDIPSLVLHSADGVLHGTGSIDLRSRRVDLTIGSDPHTTGPLALDVPLHIGGSLSDPSIGPALGGTSVRQVSPATSGVLDRLPPALRELATVSACR